MWTRSVGYKVVAPDNFRTKPPGIPLVPTTMTPRTCRAPPFALDLTASPLSLFLPHVLYLLSLVASLS